MRSFEHKLIAIIVGLLLLSIVVWFVGQYQKNSSASNTPAAITTAQPVSSVIGRSVQGRDITATTYGIGPTHILLVGGIHGGYEWNSALLAYNLMDYLNQNPSAVPANISVTIVPDANPDAIFKVTGKNGRFSETDVSTSTEVLKAARFNADDVDLNRNFACNWQPNGTWQNKTVSAGMAAFSEPETKAVRVLVEKLKPVATVFWHSAAGAVYASHCDGAKIAPRGLTLMNVYAKAAGYPTVDTFDSYPVNGAADDWMSTIGLPAVTVELSSHNSVEFDRNLAGVKAILQYYGEEM